MTQGFTQQENELIDQLITRFVTDKRYVEFFLNSVLGYLNDPRLVDIVHSTKHRLKNPDNLRRKLRLKLARCKDEGVPFDYTVENLFTQINDLGGIRILHLHTQQFGKIHNFILDMVEEQKISLFEEPFARTWDDEYRHFFRNLGVRTEESPDLYTSVHYVLSSGSKTLVTCEIQVRTLMEEVWGEVDHSINYPNKVASIACREQIKALARVTSSATRLVDSLFASFDDFKNPATSPVETAKLASPMVEEPTK